MSELLSQLPVPYPTCGGDESEAEAPSWVCDCGSPYSLALSQHDPNYLICCSMLQEEDARAHELAQMLPIKSGEGPPEDCSLNCKAPASGGRQAPAGLLSTSPRHDSSRHNGADGNLGADGNSFTKPASKKPTSTAGKKQDEMQAVDLEEDEPGTDASPSSSAVEQQASDASGTCYHFILVEV